MNAGELGFYDKVDTKFGGWTEEDFKNAGVRVVPLRSLAKVHSSPKM